MKKLYIAIDFDGTVVEDKYPKIGELKPLVKETINKQVEDGHKVIISSCRSGKDEMLAFEFLLEMGIRFHCFNNNHPDLISKYRNDCRKIGADLYIDDKSVFCNEIDWQEIGAIVDAKTK